MSNQIHPTAIVSPKALLGDGNIIGPYCIIGDNVEIGDDNVFTAYCSIGMPAEHKNCDTVNEGVIIDSFNTIREFVTINQGTKHPTRIYSECYIMRGCHIGHDAIIHSSVTMACNVIIGGHVVVHPCANLGLGSIVHQNVILAPGSMLGMGTVVPKSITIEEWKIYAGNPAKYLKPNDIGKQRANLDKETLDAMQANWIKSLVESRRTK